MRHLLRNITLRRLFEHPFRTALTILGISLGVAAFISVRIILDTMSDSFSQMIDTVSGRVQLQITGGELGVDEDVYRQLTEQDANGRLPVPGLRTALPTIQAVTRYGDESVLVLAVDTLNDKAARDYRMVGENDVEISDPLEFLNSLDSLLLNRAYAKRHGIGIDDTIELLTAGGRKPFRVRGLLEEQGAASTFGGNFALMDVYAAQQYFGRGAKFDSIDLLLEKDADVAAVKAATEKFLGGRYDVQRPEQRNEGVESMTRTFRMGLTVMALVVLAMGGFIIFNTITTTIYQRMREIGILRMVGVTRLKIWFLFAIEALALGSVGSALGVAAGYFAGREAVLNFMNKVSGLFVPTNMDHATFTMDMVVRGCLLGLGVSLVGASWPAFRAARVPPLDVVRFGPGLAGGKGSALGRWSVAMAVAAIAVTTILAHPTWGSSLDGIRASMILLLILGITATPLALWMLLRVTVRVSRDFKTPLVRLAAENVLRDLGRSAMTVSAFMVALAVMAQIYLFMNSTKSEVRGWIDDVLKADLLVTSSSRYASRTSVPMDPAMADTLRALPGVTDVVPLRLLLTTHKGSRMSILSLDFATRFNPKRFRFVKGDPAVALPAFLANEGILVTQNLLVADPGLGVGDTFELMTPKGRRGFRILGVVMDYTTEGGVAMINRPLFLDAFADPLVDTFQIYLQPGYDPAAARQSIDKAFGAQFNLFVLTNREFRGSLLETVDHLFLLALALEIITLAIALIGIVNNLLANVIDRTREIGVLRSLGATRAQVSAVFLVQAGLLGLAGACVATACGFALGWVQLTRLNSVMAGWAMPMHYDVAIIAVAFVASVVIAVASGVLPARKAAGLVLHEALKYE